MMRFDCRKAQALLDGVGPPTVDQQQALDVHLACCEECRQRQQLWSGLQTALRQAPLPTLDPMVERRLLTGKVPVHRRPAERTGRPWIAAAALATVCGAAAAWIVIQIVVPDPGTPNEASRAPSRALVQIDHEIDNAPQALTCAAPGTALWLEDTAVVVEERNDRVGAHFHLDRGLVVAEVGSNAPGYRFVVQTPTVLVEAHGTIFSVEVRTDGKEVVRVTEGVVEVIDVLTRVPVGQVRAGEEMFVADAQPQEVPWAALAEDLALIEHPEPTSDDGLATTEVVPVTTVAVYPYIPEPLPALVSETPGTVADPQVSEDNLALLTSLAHAHQRAGEYESACGVYQRIMESHPDSSAAHNSLVTLGQIELSALNEPGQALGHFDAYLAQIPQGVLAEEAQIGRIRALTQLGRDTDVVGETSVFLGDHPNSSALAEMLRLRGDAHLEQGETDLATQDYEALLARWPASPQASPARAGLAACTEK